MSEWEQRIFFGDCDTREKAIERFHAFTGSELSARELVKAFEEMSQMRIADYFLHSISTWIN